MKWSRSYRNALVASIALHLSIGFLLFMEPSSHQPPVLERVDQPELVQSEAAQLNAPMPEPIKATSVDAKEVMNKVNELKEQRQKQEQAEARHQKELEKQADLARKARVEEQQRLQHLKEEADKIAIAHKKQLEEEKKHLEQVAKQKAEEEKRLAEMKKQQQKEAEKLAQLKKKQDDEKKRLDEANAKRLAEAKRQQDAAEKANKEQKLQDARKQAAIEAEKNARIAGEVDRYKALIINAISRQWILPENTQNGLASQFRIRLAPDGSVMEVTLTRSSGDNLLDHSAQSAIYKASPLPVPTDPDAFNTFRDISLTVRPENVRG